MSIKFWSGSFGALVALSAMLIAARGQDAASLSAPGASLVKVQSVVNATEADIKAKGILGIEPHVAELEQALAGAPKSAVVTGPESGTTIVLTDGPTDTLIALAAVAGDKSPSAKGRKVEAVQDPYVLASLYLGIFYNEVGRPDEALRVLDAGLALADAHATFPGLAAGEHRPGLVSERGTALFQLKRWSDALADYDDGLKLNGLPDKDRARLLRGRGFALTELKRLDEAEAAYRESLKLEPSNALAENELKYIAQLRATGKTAPPEINTGTPRTQ
jgi:tetratricopeptide (TPR) repeat protein